MLEFTPEEKQFLEGIIEEARRFPSRDLGQDVISVDGYCKELGIEFRRLGFFEALARQHGIGYAISFGETRVPRKLIEMYRARLKEYEGTLRENLFGDQIPEDFSDAGDYLEAEAKVLATELATIVLGTYYTLVQQTKQKAHTG